MHKSSFTFLIKLHILLLIALQLIRLFFLLYHNAGLHNITALSVIFTFVVGIIFDSCIVSSFLTGGLIVSLPVLFFDKKKHSVFLKQISLLICYFILLINIADVFFFRQFGTRLNIISDQITDKPVMILTTVWKSYPVITILLATLLFTITIYKTLIRFNKSNDEVKTKWIIYSITYFFAFSFLYYGPPLWTISNYCGNPILSQASMNGGYTLIKSIHQNNIYKNDLPDLNFTDNETALIHLKSMIKGRNETYLLNNNSLNRKADIESTISKRNIVIVLMESFGGRFVGKLNEGKGYTPYFDSLSSEGILFTRCKSNGPRTQNGITSLVSGFPSILGINLIRRKGINEFHTLGNILADIGYETAFIHNGYSSYDDMNLFMKQSGFQTIFDVNDFKTWRIKNEWGVSDEDLYDQAYKMIWSDDDKPKFSFLLTMSNHEPFEIPNEFKKTHPEVNKMPKQIASFYYSDYALGEFMKKCKQHPQYKNTIFLFVADHGEAFDANDNDYKIFHIPALLINSSHGIGTFNKTCSQIDFANTLLYELSFKGARHFVGQNIFDENFKPFAVSRSYGNHIYYTTDSLMMKYFFDNDVAEFYDISNHEYGVLKGVSTKTESTMKHDAQLYMQSATYMFKNGQYRFR